ncbi:MAG: DUF817 family protein [Bdellovibrionota bacterium]
MNAFKAVRQSAGVNPSLAEIQGLIRGLGIATVFPIFIFAMLATSKHEAVQRSGIARYDLLFLACAAFQLWLWIHRRETLWEIVAVLTFHLLGFFLELHKVAIGNWRYPEEAIFKLVGVPLYSGFMYASVACFLLALQRSLRLRVVGWPSPVVSCLSALLVYVNFFTNHYTQDARLVIAALLVVAFWRASISVEIAARSRRMRLLPVIAGLGLLVWVAENIATFLGAWEYSYQTDGWQLVSFRTAGSWTLLVFVNVVVVVICAGRSKIAY